MSDIPASLKAVTPYIRRAGEVEKTGDPRAFIVAYFCRTYAMEHGLELSKKGRDNEVQTFLLGLMTELEKSKNEHAELSELDECAEVVRNFAAEKMTEAEDEYMSGTANKNTARRFYAAASFLEVLATFSESKTLDESTKKQSLFAKFRATQILKALKEGRQPVPTEEELANARGDGDGASSGGDEGDLEVDLPPEIPSYRPSIPSPPPAAPSFKPIKSSDSDNDDDDDESEDDLPLPKRVVKPSKRSSRRAKTQDFPPSGLSDAQKADALEYTRFALRAIETDDISVAVEHLNNALKQIS